MLHFPDKTKASVFGLDEIMAELYAEGRKASYDTADEIIERLKEKKNFIPSSVTAHREYAFVLLQEYRNYIQQRSNDAR
jgi:molybdopterin synthase catalytic subunit